MGEWASVCVDFGLFNFQNLLHTQEPVQNTEEKGKEVAQKVSFKFYGKKTQRDGL